MSDTPRTDDIWYDPSRKYNGQLASSLYDLCRDLERENTVLCEKWRMAEDQCFDQVGKIGDLERENAALRAALEEVLPSLKGDMAVSIAFGDPRNMHEYTRLYQRVCEALGKTP